MSCPKVESPGALDAFRASACQERQRFRSRVLICMTGCRALGAADLCTAFRAKLQAAHLADEVAVVEVGCLGKCARAPLIMIEPQEYLYGAVKVADVDEIIETTLATFAVVDSLRDGRRVDL